MSAIPSEQYLFGIISELRRLNRSIALPLERDLKRAGCPPLERCEVLREIDKSGDVHLSPVELQTRLAVPRDRMSRLIDRLAKDGDIERERVASDGRGHFVVITDLGRRASKHASSVLSAALREFFYSKETRMNSEAHNKALVIEAFDTLFNKRDYAGAERFWSPTYIQHSAHISPGREGLFGLIKSLPATLKYEHGLIIAEGDYVIAHGRFSGIRASQKLDHRRYCPDQKWRSRGALGCDRRRVVRSELEKWSSDVRGQVSRLTATTALSPSTTSFEAR